MVQITDLHIKDQDNMSYKDNIVLITKYNNENHMDGNVGKKDCEKILQRFGWKELASRLNPSIYNRHSIIYYLDWIKRTILMCKDIENIEPSTIVMIHPVIMPQKLQFLLRRSLNKHKLCLLVFDIDAWRGGPYWYNDRAWLNQADILIVHNEKMAKHLRETGIDHPYIVSMGIIDYLADIPTDRNMVFQRSVAFAGNLQKSKFLPAWVNLSRNYDINLYGIGWNAHSHIKRVTYHGSFPASELPSLMTGGFGLVWDGDSNHTETGPMGNYNRYNHPHKFSLYIASGMPVMVWSQAAVADVVRKYDIGFCIDSLDDINDIMNDLSEERYKELCDHIKPLQKDIISGKFLESAVKEALKFL